MSIGETGRTTTRGRSAAMVGVTLGGARAAFRAQLAIVAGTMPVIVFVVMANQALIGWMTGAGVALILAALLVAAWVPTSAGSWFVYLLACDVVAITLIRWQVPTVGASGLLVLPALWAAYAYGARGVIASNVWCVGVLWLGAPGEWDALDSMDTARLVAIPAVIIAVSVTVAALSGRERAQQEILRKQSTLLEQTLRETREQVRLIQTVLRSVDFTVVAFDGAGEVRVDNVEGRGRVSVVDLASFPVDPGVALSPLDRALGGEEIDDEFVRVRDPEGFARTFAVTVRQFGDEGAEEGGVLVARDVTAEQQALRAREDLIASVSHELRTPITSILGSIELAREHEELPPNVAQLLDMSARNAERLVELVGGILASAREHQVEVVMAPCDLVDVVTSALESAAPVAHSAGIRLHTAENPAHVPVIGDAFRLRQVVDNLLNNAIKYNRSGGSVDVGAVGYDGHAWVIVRDTGIGISASDQERLFERFFRSDAVRRSGVHGTGLGLAISRDIVEKHGGELSVTSELGEGTTFTVRLPTRVSDSIEPGVDVSLEEELLR